jgi:hypothetical protein
VLLVRSAPAKELIQHFHSALRVVAKVFDTMCQTARAMSGAVQVAWQSSVLIAKHWVLVSEALRNWATVLVFAKTNMDAQVARDLCRSCHFAQARQAQHSSPCSFSEIHSRPS